MRLSTGITTLMSTMSTRLSTTCPRSLRITLAEPVRTSRCICWKGSTKSRHTSIAFLTNCERKATVLYRALAAVLPGGCVPQCWVTRSWNSKHSSNTSLESRGWGLDPQPCRLISLSNPRCSVMRASVQGAPQLHFNFGHISPDLGMRTPIVDTHAFSVSASEGSNHNVHTTGHLDRSKIGFTLLDFNSISP